MGKEGSGCVGTSLKIVGALFVLGVLAKMCAGTKTETASSTAPSATAAPAVVSAQPEKLPKVSAATLAQAYAANEVSADRQYKGRRFNVVGPVVTIQKDILDQPQLILISTLGGVVANNVSENFAASLHVGDNVSVNCSVSGSTLGSVSLDCGAPN